MDLKDILWGDDCAENDRNLLKYFVDAKKVERMVKASKSIIVGRKGAGKSAVRKYISDYMESKADKMIVVETQPKYSFLQEISEENENMLKNEVFYRFLWIQHLFQLALIKVGDQCAGKKVSASEEYARKMAKEYEMATPDFIEALTNAAQAVKVTLGEKGDFGLNIENQIRRSLDVDTYTYHIKKLVTEEYKFCFIVDDLDLGWDNSKAANDLLQGLLNSITYIKDIINVNIFVCIRNDIYDMLMSQTTHSDKFRNCEQIRWDDLSLKKLLIERLEFNYRDNNEEIPEDIFHTVFPEKVGNTNVENWLIERTLLRPRELIQLVRIYTENTSVKDVDKLKKAEESYSKWKLNDLCTEYRFSYPGLEQIFNYWIKEFYRCKYHLPKDDYEKMVEKIFEEVDLQEKWYDDLVEKNDIVGFMNILYKIGFLGDFIKGGQGGTKVVYSYQDDDMPKLKEVQIHPCYRKVLGTVERIRKKKGEEN